MRLPEAEAFLEWLAVAPAKPECGSAIERHVIFSVLAEFEAPDAA